MVSGIRSYGLTTKKGIGSKDYKPLRRMCKRCENMYLPEGRFQKICSDCAKKSWLKGRKRLLEYNRKRRLGLL